MTNLKNIFLSVAILTLAGGCSSGRTKPTESESPFTVNTNEFKNQVSALYPDCEYVTLSVVGPGYYDHRTYCYRVTSVIKLANGSRKKVQMLCTKGVCWEKEVFKRDEE